MFVDGTHYLTVWMNRGSVFMIDQNRLPFEFRIAECRNHLETCRAIRDMTVRGAGAIGAAAGFAMAQVFLEADRTGDKYGIDNGRRLIENTRPTARDLFYAVEQVYRAGQESVRHALDKAQQIATDNIREAEGIGRHGSTLIRDNMKILTHCNAGWLGFVDWGSALAPVYFSKRNGKEVYVFVDETRPRGQGARLTAWELSHEGIPHAIIPDNAAAYFMSRGEIDLVIVGADRVAANGDVANKIGTLGKALAAREYKIPFYVAAPLSTFDPACASGLDIPIEYRDPDEVLYQTGLKEGGGLERILVCNPGSSALNPAFDVTPAPLISGIITGQGIIPATPEAVMKYLEPSSA
ncbi:MAG: S-methyl-5-thioribose-1-phosphate isomerase [Bacteroidales bacterium]|nr:S-methyl-5-thioribose-1-phosphate isomerase [Bacteroidales bacterium]